MILAILITIALLGAVWVYGIPIVQKAVPASWSQSTWAQVALAGTFLLITVVVVHFVVKAIGVKAVASA